MICSVQTPHWLTATGNSCVSVSLNDDPDLAAAVAADKADTAFGVTAVASRYDLGFIPFLTDRSLPVCQDQAIGTPQAPTPRETLHSEAGQGHCAICRGATLTTPASPFRFAARLPGTAEFDPPHRFLLTDRIRPIKERIS